MKSVSKYFKIVDMTKFAENSLQINLKENHKHDGPKVVW